MAHTLRVLEIGGTTPGPHVYLQAALHAGEVMGIGVLQHLLEQLPNYTLHGTLTLVPCANPYGIDQKAGEYTQGRFDPSTGENWNRQFVNLWDEAAATDLIQANQDVPFKALQDKYRAHLITRLQAAQQGNAGYGATLAHTLQGLALNADVALDLHCDSITVPYAYVPSFAVGDIRHLHMPFLMATPKTFSPCFNEAFFYPWWQFTDLYTQLTGQNAACPVRSCTYEVGAKERLDQENVHSLGQGLLDFCCHMGLLTPKAGLKPRVPENIILPVDQFKRMMAPVSGIVRWTCPLGKPVERGAEIGRILKPTALGTDEAYHIIQAPKNLIPITQTASAIVMEGAELYKYLSLEEI